MAVLGLHFCARAFPSCGKWRPLFIAVRRPPTTAAPLAAEHWLQTRRLSSCGSRAQPLHGMWDPPRPGLEPGSPALAGRFSTTAPPGKPKKKVIFCILGNGTLLRAGSGKRHSPLAVILFSGRKVIKRRLLGGIPWRSSG